MIRIMILTVLLIAAHSASAQSVRSLVNSGNELYDKKQFSDAEAEYRKSLEKEKDRVEGSFNLGNAVHKQQRFDEAIQQYHQAMGKTDDKNLRSQLYYNMGNSYFEANQYQESINAYKNALKLNPNDEDAKYNLAYAMLKMKKSSDAKKEPSEWAKRLKMRADALVAQSKFEAAYKLMDDGLKRDPTVAAFNDFISRLGVVVGVKQRNVR